MSFVSPNSPDSQLHFPGPASVRDSLLSPSHFCTPQKMARISKLPSWLGRPEAPMVDTVTARPPVTIRLQKPSYLDVGKECRWAAGTRRRSPKRLLAIALLSADSLAQLLFASGANGW